MVTIEGRSYRTLFLDRDGVINRYRPHDYAKNLSEFELLPGVIDAIVQLSQRFDRIVIVTNQRGIGKGLFSVDDLEEIHRYLMNEVHRAGGRIDKIYYCTDTENDSPNRKPNSGMALQAKQDFPEIVFEESIVIGDSESDMEFGRRLGMKTIFIDKSDSSSNLPAVVNVIINAKDAK